MKYFELVNNKVKNMNNAIGIKRKGSLNILDITVVPFL